MPQAKKEWRLPPLSAAALRRLAEEMKQSLGLLEALAARVDGLRGSFTAEDEEKLSDLRSTFINISRMAEVHTEETPHYEDEDDEETHEDHSDYVDNCLQCAEEYYENNGRDETIMSAVGRHWTDDCTDDDRDGETSCTTENCIGLNYIENGGWSEF